jgi:hypothetical protein
MEARYTRVLRAAVMAVLLLLVPGLLTAIDIPKFEKPILVTCTGQTPGSLTLSTLLNRLGIAHTHDPMTMMMVL